MTFSEPPTRQCANPEAAVAAAHAWPAGALQYSYRGRWAHQLGAAWPEPRSTDNAPELNLAAICDLLGALYDGCPCAQLRGRLISSSDAELFLLLFYAYDSASGGGPFGIRLTAQQLVGLFNSAGGRALLEFRRAGAAAAVQLVSRMSSQERMDALIMATTRIVSGFRNVGSPPDDAWILDKGDRARLGDDEMIGCLDSYGAHREGG
jgi:hypothetical protein